MNKELLKRKLAIKFLEKFAKLGDKALKLYFYQKNFMLDTRRYRIVNKARQLGFSYNIAAEGLMEALMVPRTLILYVSTGEKAAKRVLDYSKDIYYSFPKKLRTTPEPNSATEFGFPNKSFLVSLPNNPSTVRGPKARRIYIDEAGHFLNESKIFAALQPAIARGGDLTVISTPNGRANRFFDIWDNEPTYSKHSIDWTQCPDETYKKTVAEMSKNMDEITFQQEFCCSFTEDNLAFIPYNLLLPCINVDLELVTGLKTRNFVFAGVDFAEKQDASAIIIAEQLKSGFVIIRYIKIFEKVPYSAQLAEIITLCKEFGVNKLNSDNTGVGIKLTEDLQLQLGEAMVEGVHFNPTTKEVMMKTLRVLLENKNIVLPQHDTLISQLRSLERSYTETGIVRFKHVGSAHDDAAWALALCVKDCTVAPVEIAYKAADELDTTKFLSKKEKEDLRNIVLIR